MHLKAAPSLVLANSDTSLLRRARLAKQANAPNNHGRHVQKHHGEDEILDAHRKISWK
jgi:hypothetical protein